MSGVRISMNESPFHWGDSTPEFRSHLRGTPTGDRGTIDIFSTNASAMASPGFCGPLGRPAPGVADTRRLPTQEAVKRKLQPTLNLSVCHSVRASRVDSGYF